MSNSGSGRSDSTPKTRGRKKRAGSTTSTTIKEEPETIDERLEGYCLGVRNILFTVAHDREDLCQRIIAYKDPYFAKLYKLSQTMESKGYKSDFYGECALRLQTMLKLNNSQGHGTVQVLTFLVIFAIRALNEKESADFLLFLADQCSHLANSRELLVRHNCCALIGFFFQFCPDIFKDPEDFQNETASDVLAEIRENLYKLVIRFSKDQNYQIRAQCCAAMEPVQDIPISASFDSATRFSPKDCISRALQDKVPLVRQTGVLTVSAVSGRFYAKELVQIASEESNLKVRKNAISKLSNIWPLTISTDDRQSLLFKNLTINDEMSEYVKKELLCVWLAKLAQKLTAEDQDEQAEKPTRAKKTNNDERRGLPAAIQHLFGDFDWQKHEDEVVRIYFAAFDVVRRIIVRGKAVSLPDMVRLLIEDDTQSPIVSRYNREELLEGLSGPEHIASSTFFWRALVQYCSETAKGPDFEADRDHSLQKLAPSLWEMCDFTEKLRAMEEPVEEPEEKPFIRRAVMECVKICSYLERDPSGVAKWKELMESLLLEAETIDSDMTYLATTLLISCYEDDGQSLLGHMLNRLSDLTHKEMDPNASQLVQVISLQDVKPERKPFILTLSPMLEQDEQDETRNDANDDPDVMDTIREAMIKTEQIWATPPTSPTRARRENSPEISHELSLQHIRVVNAILKTGAYKRMNPYLLQINSFQIPKCIASNDEELAAQALSVASILALMDAEIARGSLEMLWTAALLYGFKSPAKIIAVNAIVDLTIQYGKTMDAWLDENGHEFTEIFNAFLINESCPEEPLLLATQGIAKLVLHAATNSSDDGFIAILASLIGRAFHPSVEDMPEVSSCILQCFSALKILGRKKMQLLNNALLYILQVMYVSAEDHHFYEAVNIERAAMGIVEMSREFVADAKHPLSLHATYLEAVMAMLTRVRGNGRFTKIYCGIIAELDIDVPLADLNRYIKMAQDGMKTLNLNEDEALDPQIVEMEKLIKRLKKMQAKLEELEEKKEQLGELPPTAARKKPPKKRNVITPLLVTPNPGLSAPNPSATTGTRQRLARSAKTNVQTGSYLDYD